MKICFGFIVFLVFVVVADVGNTDWARNAGWCEHSGVRFSGYAEGEALSDKGTVRGHWLADDAQTQAETSAHVEDGITWMYLHAPTNLTFVTEPEAKGGGCVLQFSVRTIPWEETPPPLAADCRAGFAVQKVPAAGGVEASARFLGWVSGQWRELTCGSVVPCDGRAVYDVAVRFCIIEGHVRARYWIKGSDDFVPLTLVGSDDEWIESGLTGGDPAIHSVEVGGIGGLNYLSSKEMQGIVVIFR